MKAVAFVVVLAAALVPAPACCERGPVEDFFAWLLGDWGRETKRGVSTESWTRVSEHTLEGMVWTTSGAETRVSEYMRIGRFGDEIFFIAKPLDNAFPTAFKLVEHGQNRLVFENPAHDFPQRIIYTRTGSDSLVARIEGIVDGASRSAEFRYERSSTK